MVNSSEKAHYIRSVCAESNFGANFPFPQAVFQYGYGQNLPGCLGELEHHKSELIEHYLYATNGKKKKRKKSEIESEEENRPKKERYLLCKQCENKITKPGYRINIQGAFDHTFLNPAGQVFYIGCFAEAGGCDVLGDASFEWTWFQGYQWQVAICGQCLRHLGWYYFSEGDSPFFGLILDTLV